VLRATPRFLDFCRARPAARGGEGEVRTARRALLRVRDGRFARGRRSDDQDGATRANLRLTRSNRRRA